MRTKLVRAFFMCLLILGFIWVMGMRFSKESSGVKVVKWSNFYNGKNIHFYYGSSEKNISDNLRETYELETIIGKEKDDFNKSIKLMQWIKDNVRYKEGIKTTREEDGASDILGYSKNNKKYYSDRECARVFNEFAIAVGITSRIGEFIALDSDENEEVFMVCEIWSEKHKKWIMMDVANGVYLTDDKIPLSAVEIIEKDMDKLNIEGIESSKKYKKKAENLMGSYIIPIDNSIYGGKNSNSYVVFLKDDDYINIPLRVCMKYPAIFTGNINLFNISPKAKFDDKKEDDIPTLIFGKKSLKQNKEAVEFYGGAFKDSVMIKDYYISINNSSFRKVEEYFDFSIKEGINTAKLSVDGKNIIREVAFELKEN